MKKIIILIAFFCSKYVIAQKQFVDYFLVYDFEYVTDTVSHTYSDPEEYLLYNISNYSYFLNESEYYNDSMFTAFGNKMGSEFHKDPEKVAIFQNEILPIAKRFSSNYRLLKDFKNAYAKIILNTFPGKSKYMNVPMALDWTMQSDMDTILGMHCRRAATTYGGRDYEVWYSTSIPISDGPYIFSGLPGLIVKVSDSEKWYSFTLKRMMTKPAEIWVHKTFMNEYVQTEISRENFVKSCTKMKENPQFPPGTSAAPEVLLKLKERYKKRFDLILEQNE